MKKAYLLFILLIITGYALNAQNGLISTCFGGSNNDGANNMQLTADGGYIFAGYTNSSDGEVTGYHGDNIHNEIWVVKHSGDTIFPPHQFTNNIQWQKCLGGSGGETVNQILLTQDGGYLVVGTTQSAPGNGSDITQSFGGVDAWIVKLDSAGDNVWQKSYGGSGNDYAYGAAQNILGHYVIAGTTNSTDSGITTQGGYDAWVFEIDSAGNLVQQHTYGGAGNDALYTVFADSSLDYFLFGNTASNDSNIVNHGGSDFWAVEINNDTITQQACFGGDSNEYLYNAYIDSAGSFILAGGTYSYNTGQVIGSFGGEDAWAVQIDTFFDFISQVCVGGSDNDYFTGVAENNGKLLLAGTTYSNDGNFAGLNHGDADIFLAQMIDYSGPLTGLNCYGGNLDDFGNGVVANSAGDVYMFGAVTSDNGTVSGNHGMQDAWIGVTTVITGIKEVNIASLQPVIFPNPSIGNFEVQFSSSQTFTGTIQLLNTLGETISTQQINVNTGVNTFNSPAIAGELAKGIYLLRITDNTGTGVTGKVVIE